MIQDILMSKLALGQKNGEDSDPSPGVTKAFLLLGSS